MMRKQEIYQQKLDAVLDALMRLGEPDFVKGKTGRSEDTKRGVIARDFGIENWDWPQGVGLYGLEKLQTLYGDTRYDAFLNDWTQRNLAEGLPSRNVNTTAPFLQLLGLAQRTGNVQYHEMCRAHAQWLMDGLPKTREGGFQHVTTGFEGKDSVILNEQQLWADTLFMAVLFLARAGRIYNVPAWKNEAVHQILIHIKYLYEKKNGLLYHGWSFLRNDNFGGIFWCRGNAWFTYGILELLEVLEGDVDDGARAFMMDTFRAQVASIAVLQRESGLWGTILDDASSYEEVSGSAAFAAGMLKGVRLGYLDESVLESAYKAVDAVAANIGEDGIVQNVSGGTGMGMDAQHYKNIVIGPMSYGQSMTAFALIEMLYFLRERGEA